MMIKILWDILVLTRMSCLVTGGHYVLLLFYAEYFPIEYHLFTIFFLHLLP